MKSLGTLINVKDTLSLKLNIADKTIKYAIPISVCGFRAAESGAR